MRLLSLLFFALQILGFSAYGQTQVCGLSSGKTLINFEDSRSEFATHISKSVAIGLGDLYSLPDVKNLIQSVNPAKVCVSAIVVGKNIYQYNELLIVLTQLDSSGHQWMTPFLFQTASVQAHENTGPKPWVGFDHKNFVRLLSDSLKNVTFVTHAPLKENLSPLAQIEELFPKSAQAADKDTQSYVFIPDVDPNWSTYLVSQLRILDTGNPFTSTYLTDVAVVQIQEETGAMRSANLPHFFDFYTAISQIQSDSQPQDLSDTGRLKRLTELSR